MPAGRDGIEVEVGKFEKTVRARNLREWIAAGFVALAFGVTGANAPSATDRLSSWLIVAAAVFVTDYLYAFGRSRLQGGGGADLPVRYRAELLRQARLLRRAPLWYAAPLMGGLLVSSWTRQSISSALITVALGVGISWLNVVASRGLQRRADALA